MIRIQRMLVVAVGAVCALASAQAQEIYGGIGFPGATIGGGLALSPSFTLRGEYTGGLSVNRNTQQNNISYTGKLSGQRIALLGDYFPMASGFRLTGGVAFNDLKLNARGVTAGSTVTVNGKTVTLGAGETIDAQVKYPGATPYLGLGYGHHQSQGPGWGFIADLGVTIGKFSTSATSSMTGKTFGTTTITQADVDAEVKKAQDAVNKISVLPVVSVGVSYRFR